MALGNLAVVLFLSAFRVPTYLQSLQRNEGFWKFFDPTFLVAPHAPHLASLFFRLRGSRCDIFASHLWGIRIWRRPSPVDLVTESFVDLSILHFKLAARIQLRYADHSPAAFRIFWSNAVEEQFYLIYPFIFVLAFRFPKSRFWIVFLALVFAVVFRTWFAGNKVGYFAMKNAGGMYYATLTYLDVVAVGCACGWICSRLMRTKMLVSRLNGQAGVLLIALCGICGWFWSANIWFPYRMGSIFIYSAMALIFGALLLWFSVTPGHWLSKLLASPPMRILGSLSFGIYLWHVIAGRLVATCGESCNLLDSSKFPWTTMAATMILTLIFASATRTCVERPFLGMRGLLTRFHRRPAD